MMNSPELSESEAKLLPFHADIVAWRAEGLSLQQITNHLSAKGLQTNRHVVDRYCTKAQIPLGEKTRLTISLPPTPTQPVSPPPVQSPPERPNTQEKMPWANYPPPTTPSGPQISTAASFTAVVPPPVLTPRPPQQVPPVRANASLATPPKVAPPPAMLPAEFPELEAYRVRILNFAYGGCTAAEIQNVLVYLFNLHVPVERLQTYLDAVFNQLHPPGQITPALCTLYEHAETWRNETPIFGFEEDVWTLSDFFEGTLILGASGSGKTSGSGRNLARAFLQAGFGGLILTTKPGEADEWVKLAQMLGRDNDLTKIRPDAWMRLDVLTYESQRPGQGGRLTENLLHFFKNLVSVLSTKRGHATNAAFWQTTGDQLLRNLLNCFLAAQLPLTIDSLAQFLTHAPLHNSAAADEQWRQIPVFGPCLTQAEQHATTAETQRNVALLKEYWLFHYPNLASDTRSCITIGFAAMVDALRAPHIHQLIATQTTFTPEAILNGRIVIVDLPINEFHEAGLLVQTLWKYVFQRVVLNRPDKNRGIGCRPVFLWEDECQNFLIDYDAEFNRVARDCRVARVLITQNINNLYDAYGGGDAARVKVESILGTLNTHIYHANGDLATNKWASERLGTHEKTLRETSTTPPQYQGFDPLQGLLHKFLKKPVVTTNTRTVREPKVQPHEFAKLLPGGPQNEMLTEALITQVGRHFADGEPFAKVLFHQIIFPDEIHSEQDIQTIADAHRQLAQLGR